MARKQKKKTGDVCTVTFLPAEASARVQPGTSIYDAATEAGVEINSVCGGQKQCGKCKVIVRSGSVVKGDAPLLDARDIAEGYVLACDTFVESDVTVALPIETLQGEGQILEGRKAEAELADELLDRFAFDPPVKKAYFEAEPPSLESSIDDTQRVTTAVGRRLDAERVEADLEVIRNITGIARTNDWKLTATCAALCDREQVIAVEGGNREAENFGLAIDVGTTTIVVHLVDINEKRTIDIAAKYNSQMKYGEDYIKRIMHIEEHADRSEMQSLVIGDINELAKEMCTRNGVRHSEITSATVAGNTAMLHFLLNLDPGNIRREPFVPVTNFPPPIRAGEIKLDLNPSAVVYPLPGVAVYVGADIVAGLLATGLYRNDELSLHIDIGTNGEIVLGNKEWMVCCSASAGPSFEGSGVKHGMRATEGAIEDIAIDKDYGVKYSTVGRTRAKGICGSGLIDCLAELFKAGLLDRTGKFNKVPGSPVREDEDGTPEFPLVLSGETLTGRDIVINQIDIQDLLRSKAAVFAAAAILVESMEVNFSDIRNIYIAGGFGNYLNIENAVVLGLLPDVPPDRYHFAGNACVVGAKVCLLSRQAMETANEIAGRMTYFDLMSNYKYMDYYQQALFLPHTNIDLFPTAKRLVNSAT